MKKLLALLLLFGIVGCEQEPTQLEKCVASNLKTIIKTNNDNKNYPESVLLSPIVNIEEFDRDWIQETYPYINVQSIEYKAKLDDGDITLEQYEDVFHGSYEEYIAFQLAKVESNNMNIFGSKVINDLFTVNTNIDQSLGFVMRYESDYPESINYLKTNIIYNNRYIDYHLNQEDIINKTKIYAEPEAIKACNSQGIY
ncbi:hypothetical protein N9I38_02675 [Gammaproteobacteria bacterium]|nr:hypothetical protein [Gammaproteobacteria bacterium]MDC1190822.1 hypothetical protein [Gammaproteobacteria bacterium]